MFAGTLDRDETCKPIGAAEQGSSATASTYPRFVRKNQFHNCS